MGNYYAKKTSLQFVSFKNKGGSIMKIVPKTKENLKKCLCMKCPSYNFACKVKSMPSNVILMLSDKEKKIHAESMFCAYEPSH